MSYLIDMEGKLRFVDTTLNVWLKYLNAPPPEVELLQPLREYLIQSSRESLVISMQQLLSLVVEGIDKGIIPTE